jgi:hypothetical protein
VLVFERVARLLVGFGPYTLLNRLAVEISRDGIVSTRTALGLRSRRPLPRADLR